MTKKHEDTTISLHPLSFEEAIKELATPTRHEDSQTEVSGNTKEVAPAPGKPKRRTARHRKLSSG